MLLQQCEIESDAQDGNDYTPFLLAAANGGELAMSRLLRTKKVNPYQLNMPGENALHLAAQCRRDNFLSFAPRHVRDVNARNRYGMTPLHKAVMINSGQNVSILLKNGADPSILDDDGFTPFVRACEGRHLGPTERLLRASHGLVLPFTRPLKTWDDNTYPHASPITLILCDFGTRCKRTVAPVQLALQIVLAAKPDLEVCDSRDQSVLSKVVKIIDSSILQDLLHAGADVNSRDDKGSSILYKAIRVLMESV